MARDGANSIGDYPKPQYQGNRSRRYPKNPGYLVPFEKSRLTIQKVGDTQEIHADKLFGSLIEAYERHAMTVLSNKRSRTNNETYGRHKRTSLR